MTGPENLQSHYPIPPAQQARSRRDGCIHLHEVLSPDTLAHSPGRFEQLVAERANREPLESRGTYGRAFQQIMNLWQVDALAREFVFSARIARIASELMGTDGVRLYHDQALYKEPQGGFTPWHCDQMYWPLASHHCTTAWIPFQDVPLEMGPLSFAIGSHRADFGRDLSIGDDSERIIARKISDLPIRTEPFQLGDISFHAGWTFHRADANRTDRLRAVMTIIYMDAQMRLKEPESREQANDWHMWCPGAAVGQVIASPKNPLLYRPGSENEASMGVGAGGGVGAAPGADTAGGSIR